MVGYECKLRETKPSGAVIRGSLEYGGSVDPHPSHLADLPPPPVAVPSRDFIPHVLHVEKCGGGGGVVVLADKQGRSQISLRRRRRRGGLVRLWGRKGE